MEQIVKDTPPVDNGKSRFGNPAFKDFYDKISEVRGALLLSYSVVPDTSDAGQKSKSLHKTIPGLPAERIEELATYFNESWGNRTRVDYGSGMELNFICWLCVPMHDLLSLALTFLVQIRLCLRKLGVIDSKDDRAVVARVFWK